MWSVPATAWQLLHASVIYIMLVTGVYWKSGEPGKCLNGHRRQKVFSMDLAGCKIACEDPLNWTCKSADHHINWGQCMMTQVDKDDVPGDWEDPCLFNSEYFTYIDKNGEVPGACIGGNNERETPAPDVASCKEACLGATAKFKCQSIELDGVTCYLNDESVFTSGDVLSACSTVYHEIVPASQGSCREFVKVEGQMIADSSKVLNGDTENFKHSYTLGSLADVNYCGALCHKNEACLSFTFRGSDGFCQLSDLTPRHGMEGYTASDGSDIYYH